MSFGTKPITLFRAIALALVLVCLVSVLLMPCLGARIREMGINVNMGIGIFSTSLGGEYTSFWSVMLIINAILLILLGGLAIFGLIKDVKVLVLPFALVGFITFFLALFQKLFVDMKILHVGRGPWLLLFLGLLAAGMTVLDHVASRKPMKEFFDLSALGIKPPQPKPARAAAPGRVSGWSCPNCGNFQPDAVQFCGNCGTRKPAPRLCPGCGKLCQPNEAFCGNCGTRL